MLPGIADVRLLKNRPHSIYHRANEFTVDVSPVASCCEENERKNHFEVARKKERCPCKNKRQTETNCPKDEEF